MKLPSYVLAFAMAGMVGPVLAADALTQWKELCAKCHGETGKGDTKMGRKLSISDLTDGSVQSKFTDEDALKAMKDGVTDKAGKVTMKPVEGVSAEDMHELLKFVRALKK